jgi:hypothetical protein
MLVTQSWYFIIALSHNEVTKVHTPAPEQFNSAVSLKELFCNM